MKSALHSQPVMREVKCGDYVWMSPHSAPQATPPDPTLGGLHV
jgi:hypothetical protein